MAKKIHINLVPQFAKLKQLEIGLCLAEVYNPELPDNTWDDTTVGTGSDIRSELRKLKGICKECIAAIPDKTEGTLYVIAFREKLKPSLEVEDL